MALAQDGPYDTRLLTKVFTFSSLALLLTTVWMVFEDHSREWKEWNQQFRELEIARREADLRAARYDLQRQRVVTLKGGEAVVGSFTDKGGVLVRDEDGREIAKASIVSEQPLEEHLDAQVKSANEELEAKRAREAYWYERLAYVEGLFQANDLKFKDAKSRIESLNYHYEHALQVDPTHAGEALENLNEMRAKLAKYGLEKSEIERLGYHGFVASEAALLPKEQGPDSQGAYEALAKRGVQGAFAGIEGDKITVKGKGTFAIKSSELEEIRGFAERELSPGMTITVVRDAGKVLAEAVVLPVLGLSGLKKRVAGVAAASKAAEKRRDELVAARGRLAESLKKIDHNFVNDWFRNEPLADFIAPSLVSKQIVIEDLRDDYFFAQIRKVDRCETCHLGIEKKDFTGYLVNVEGRGMIPAADIEVDKEELTHTLTYHDGRVETLASSKVIGTPKALEQPFTSHPNLDLFMGSLSPHPKGEFGCTVCHEGEGRSMEFNLAAHSPADAKQREEWEKTYHWHKRHHWDHPQVRKPYLESSCLLCHENNRPVPQAPKLNFGREVWERVGCFGCHKMKGFTEERKQGPDLRRLASKLNKGWVYAWLENPANFRAKTNMPRFWFGADNAQMESEERKAEQEAFDRVEIVAVTEYLFHQSKEFKLPQEAAAPKGSVEDGERLYSERGCAGCHQIDGAVAVDTPRTYAPNEYGPNLSNIGDKLGYAWLYSWVKNPQHYWAETNMPNLQLSDDEAHNVAAYLASLRSDADYEYPQLTKADREVTESLLRTYLEKEYAPAEVQSFLAGDAGAFFEFDEMERGLNLGDEQDRLLYLGRQTLTRYGCYGCHYVGGMETRPGIGAELSNIGDKDLKKVDWGHTSEEELPRWREDWMRYKVKEPRYVDEGRFETLGYLDRARMPKFNLTEAEREALITFLAGHTERKVPKHYVYTPSARKRNQIDGSYQIYRKNCKACHMLDVDEITLRRYKVPEDEVDEELEVDGRSVEGWMEVLEDGEDAGEKMAAVKALEKAGAYFKLKEVLEGLDPEPGTIALREAVASAVLSLRKRSGYEDVTVAGVLLFDNRFQLDERTGAVLRNARGEPKPWPMREDEEMDGEVMTLPDGSEVPARGVAVIQLWEDAPQAGDRKAGGLVPVTSNLNAPAEVFYSEIVAIKPRAAGAETPLPSALIERYPGDFQPQEGHPWRARQRGGMSIPGAAWVRLLSQGQDDVRKLAWDYDLSSVTGLATGMVEARGYAAPHLRGEGEKVQTPWLRSFLLNPSAKIRPWLNMRMPNYHMSELDSQQISLYFAANNEDEVIAEATAALEALQQRIKSERAEGVSWDRGKVQAAVTEALAPTGAGDYFSLTIADNALGFKVRGDISKIDSIEEKTVSYQAEREQEHPYWYSKGHDMFIAAQCLSCHIWEGRTPGKDDPSSWGPDLSRAPERIKPKWFSEWVHNPQEKIPGTKMSQQFTKGYRDVLDAPIETQIEVLKDWVYAGMEPAFEVFPKEVQGGQTVRITSAMLPLDNIDVLYASGPAGILKYSVEDGSLVKEKSEGRTIAFVITMPADAGSYLVTTSRPDKPGTERKAVAGLPVFDGRARVTVVK